MPRVGGNGGGAPSGAAGGVLAGTYPNPAFAADMATQSELNAAQAALDAKRLDQVAAPTADVTLNNQKIIGLATPSASTEAANKAYVDAIAQGFDVKMSVRAATTANITLSGAQTIDGVSVVATNRVLVKNQTTASENGIYVAAAGAWSRATDADTDAEVTAGLFTFVEEGTVAADQGWALATNNPITLGTTALSFTQVAGTGGGGAPTGAAGGDLAGSTYPNPVIANGAVTIAKLSFDPATQVELDAHVNDTSAAHAAASIGFTPDGSIAATNVQAAIQEVRDEAGAGTSVNDQTISTTDNTVNNVSTSKHGWMAKLPNGRSWYFNGKGEWNYLHGANEWFVDPGVAVGGDGKSPSGAFKTFAAANAAADSRDIIYILADIQENGILTKQDVTVQGVGMPVWYAMPGASPNNTSLDVRVLRAKIDNIYFNGHATFRGVHLLLNNYGNYYKVTNIFIDGTGGIAYGSTPYPTAPGTTGQFGYGGIGILCHHAEVGSMDNLMLSNCSIGIGLGTWSTRAHVDNVITSGNCHDLVVGLYTGPAGNIADVDSTMLWGLPGHGGPSDDQAGMSVFRNWSCINANPSAAPHVDLIGDGTANYAGNSGFGNLFDSFNHAESGGAPVFRIGTKGNTFINCYNSIPASWHVKGQRNRFVNTFLGYDIQVFSDYNTFDGAWIELNAGRWGLLRGTGNYNTFRDVMFARPDGGSWFMSGFGNQFKNCTFDKGGSSVAISRTDFGPFPQITARTGHYASPYSTSVQAYTGLCNMMTIPVTNTTAFTILNPLDTFNAGDNTKILSTEPLTLDIFNSSGGTMGAITWGSKFALAGAFVNPANGKRRTITFYYNFTSDKWVEINRAAADI